MSRSAWFSGEVLRDEVPAAGVAAFRAGVRCDRSPFGHPHQIVAAESFRELDARIRRWRCPVCGAPAFGTRLDRPRPTTVTS